MTDNFPPLMRAAVLLVLLACLATIPVKAQNPLVGTWEMISARGVGANGEKFYLDSTSVKETKIITPTHYMLIAWDVEKDSLIFNRTMAGTVRIEGDKYIETPSLASVQIFDNIKVDFRWKLEGDIFKQSGTIVRPDGKTVVLEALLFRRVKDVRATPKNPAIGTWKQISGEYTASNGKTNPSFNTGDTGLLIVTPTHWMRMDHKNKKFNGALVGTYDVKGDNVVSHVSYSSYGGQTGEDAKIVQKVDGNKIHFITSGKTPEGEIATFRSVYERVK